MRSKREVRRLTQEALSKATVSVEGVAEEAGLSSSALYAWMVGRRNPSLEKLKRLVDALERRGEKVSGLAAELRRAIEE